MTPSRLVDDGIAGLQTRLRHGPWAVLTGAGLSTGSGIPAYRDRHGQWVHAQPIQHQAFMASETVRRRYWARSFAGWPTIGQAVPNAGHEALAHMEQLGWISQVITQNVDGLHHRAGSRAVIELHGSIRTVHCLACQQRYPRTEVQTWMQVLNDGLNLGHPEPHRPAPDGDAHLDDSVYESFQVPPCPACQGLLKPDVVFFGDNVPRERVASAAQAIEQASGLLVVGSSLMVYSGFRFVELAHRLGKPIVAINHGVTRADALLTAKIDADCASTLEQLQSTLETNVRFPHKLTRLSAERPTG